MSTDEIPRQFRLGSHVFQTLDSVWLKSAPPLLSWVVKTFCNGLSGTCFFMIIAAENNWLPSAIVGALLVTFGLLWMWSHARAWRVEQTDESLGEFDRAHFANRFRRRMQTSGMVVLIGILIPVGDIFVWNWGPWTSTGFWLGVLFLAMWVVVQALGDFTAVQSYSRAAMASVNSKRQQAEAELAEYRRRQAEDSE